MRMIYGSVEGDDRGKECRKKEGRGNDGEKSHDLGTIDGKDCNWEVGVGEGTLGCKDCLK